MQTQKTENSSTFIGSDSRQDFNVSAHEPLQQLVIEKLHEEPVVNNTAKSVVSPSDSNVSIEKLF